MKGQSNQGSTLHSSTELEKEIHVICNEITARKTEKVQSYQGSYYIQANDWQKRVLFFSVKTARKISKAQSSQKGVTYQKKHLWLTRNNAFLVQLLSESNCKA